MPDERISSLACLKDYTFVAAGVSVRTLVANADGTGLRRVPLVASPIEIAGVVVGAGGEGVGEGAAAMGSALVALMMAGESKLGPGTVASPIGIFAGGLLSLSEVFKTCDASTWDGAAENARISESGSLSPLTFFVPIVLGIAGPSS